MVSKREVARQGDVLVNASPDSDEYLHAIEALEQWRDAHQYPMEQIELAVKDASADVDGTLHASRLKRRDTIINKLKRPGHNYTLRNLDDIAGCRCIVPTIDDVFLVAERLRSHPGYVRDKDRISEPKADGYRSLHLFHRCDSPDFGCDNLRVETQVRTQEQHAWATAVETYDVIFASGLKFGRGNEGAKREFALMSNLIAFNEDCALVPGTPITPDETMSEMLELDKKQRILANLQGFCRSVRAIENSTEAIKVSYYLLEFNYVDQLVTITAFSKEEIESALRIYSEKERAKVKETDVLLVKTDSVESLKEAYPNYFSDISTFLILMQNLTQGFA